MATLTFKGKPFVQNYHLTVPYHQLVPKKDKSLTDKVRLDDNLIVHGDNLKALKALLPTYAGKVKCIYIDPPYNTGNEKWVYNDNVNSPMMQEWLGKVVDREDLTRHDKWLCMMMPRLKILRDLLSDDGLIFVSIGDDELANLRFLMDEAFHEGRFVGLITWKARVKPVNIGDAKYRPQRETEYVLVYEKTASQGKFRPLSTGGVRSYPHTFKGRKYRVATILKSNRGANRRETMCFELEGYTPPEGQRWQAGEDVIRQLWRDEYIEFREGVPFRRYFEDEEGAEHDPFYCFMDVDWSGTSESGKGELNEILGSHHGFDTVKPSQLISTLIQSCVAPDRCDIVLDSFAGSGTTAQAVLALNKADGGNRRFILVECEDYADKITAERVSRVIKGVPQTSDETLKKGLGGTFSYFELGKSIEVDGILEGKDLPNYIDLARYIFYTATGQEFNERKVDEKRHFIGSSEEHDVYLLYKPDIQFLKDTALTLERARALGPSKGKRRLVFAPTKYLDQEQLAELHIDFAQLPFEIYRLAE